MRAGEVLRLCAVFTRSRSLGWRVSTDPRLSCSQTDLQRKDGTDEEFLAWVAAHHFRLQPGGEKEGKASLRPAGLRRSFVPRLDVLEDRTLPSTLTVRNLHDSGTDSLRAALTTANAHAGDTIEFANGLHGTIMLTSGELLITANVTINRTRGKLAVHSRQPRQPRLRNRGRPERDR